MGIAVISFQLPVPSFQLADGWDDWHLSVTSDWCAFRSKLEAGSWKLATEFDW
jgi:hypothetical protein